MVGIEGPVLRALGKVVGWVVPQVRSGVRRREILDDTRPLVAATVGKATLDELTGPEAEALAAYLDTPDFEQVAFHFALAASQTAKGEEELLQTAALELWHGIRRHAGLDGDRLLRTRDLVMDALVAARHTLPTTVFAGGYPGLAHHTAAAARNGALLREIGSLAAVHRKAGLLRRQAGALHAEIRLPHTGVSRTVPWGELYVEPRLATQPWASFTDTEELLRH
ncbi:hypothetical protein AB0I28_30220 [Phytomonospora sp. NPDC050363]|uniref:hypothetical protein n=1 Tax=Phytomonospora sp. NPDC050363 TaxID=3155642 RepID=UPI0033C51018